MTNEEKARACLGRMGLAQRLCPEVYDSIDVEDATRAMVQFALEHANEEVERRRAAEAIINSMLADAVAWRIRVDQPIPVEWGKYIDAWPDKRVPMLKREIAYANANRWSPRKYTATCSACNWESGHDTETAAHTALDIHNKETHCPKMGYKAP